MENNITILHIGGDSYFTDDTLIVYFFEGLLTEENFASLVGAEGYELKENTCVRVLK